LRTVNWKTAAITDLLAIITYIADDNPDAAQTLNDDIAGRVSKLIAHPHAYRVGRVADTREMAVRPNYVVVYAVTEQAVTI
jgi:toxin ParE1/3/4